MKKQSYKTLRCKCGRLVERVGSDAIEVKCWKCTFYECINSEEKNEEKYIIE